MSYYTSMYAVYKDGKGNVVPLHGESMVSDFDQYIPGEPGEDPGERFCRLEKVEPGELPGFMREEYGEDGGGHMFARISLSEFREMHEDAIDRYMKAMSTAMEAMGMRVDDSASVFNMEADDGRYDEDGNADRDYEKQTWRIDKRLVMKAVGRWNDMASGVEALGIYRVIRDMVPSGVSGEDVTLILARG